MSMERHIRRIATALAACVLLCAVLPTAQGKGSDDALRYVKSQQAQSGGFFEPGAEPDGTTTCWAVIAAASAGERIDGLRNGGANPIEFLQAQAASLSALDDLSLHTLALSEAKSDARNVEGRDLVALINTFLREGGRIGETAEEHCMAMLALMAAEAGLPPESTGWLMENQRADGGWGESDNVVIKDTALAVEALVAAGEESSQGIESAIKYLRGKMGPEGGFANGGRPNASLTASVVRAISAAGQDPTSEYWSWHGNNPLSFLESLQAEDGHFEYSKGKDSEPVVTTSLAVIAGEGRHLPLSAGGSHSVSATGIKDLGMIGAGMVPGADAPATPLAIPGDRGEPVPGGAGTSKGSFSGLWLFLMICGVYLLTLLASGLIAAKLYEPPPLTGPGLES